MAVCAYCAKEAAATKEHLWPAALHRRLMLANSQEKSTFWLTRVRQYLQSEPQIRDVCGTCNNGTLSALDSYICGLFDKYFVDIPTFGNQIEFGFDYHRLKRWLLKMSFNSARIHDSPDLIALQALRPYILGENDHLGASVQVFLRLAYPERVAASELDPSTPFKDDILLKPEIHRTGHVLFRPNATDEKLMRTVFLRAFHFHIAYWPPGAGRAMQNDFESALKERWPHVKLLRPNIPVIELKCAAVGAWQALKGATDCQFVFSDGDASLKKHPSSD
jgi:hypothetical protein